MRDGNDQFYFNKKEVIWIKKNELTDSIFSVLNLELFHLYQLGLQ